MATMEMDFTFKLAIATRHDEELGIHVGYCPALGIYSQGRSTEEAEEAVASALTLFMGECYERGLLHDILRSKGFTQISARHATAKPAEYITVSGFDRVVERSIPLQLLAGRMHDVPCGTGSD